MLFRSFASAPDAAAAVLAAAQPPEASQQTSTCSFRCSQLIGEGSAHVYRATVTSSNIPAAPRGHQVAVKVYDTRDWTSEHFKNVRAEINAMAKLKHKNIVGFYCCKYSSNGSFGSHQRRPNARGYASFGSRAASSRGAAQPQIVIVQELCSRNDLFDNISKYGALPATIAKHYCKELLDAVAFMHKRRVSHRDLKLENIVLDSAWTLKV